jgi:hypothetical protein
MKNINKSLIVFAVASVLLFGCEDFLEEAPITTISTETFFKTDADFLQAKNAAYSSLHSLSGSNLGINGGFWVFSEMRSDNTTFQYNPVDRSGFRFWDLDRFLMTTDNNLVINMWRDSYDGIGKCNTVIARSEDADYENKDQYVAEAKFLRALYYSYLVKYFGDVPLITAPPESYEEGFSGNKRIAKAQVYELIISDLNDAKDVLPDSYGSGDFGKATSGAARTLLARELMWTGNYAEAAQELEIVKNSGVYSLQNDYAAVFDIANENNSEIIFSVQFIEGPYGLSSEYMYQFTPWNSGTSLLPFQQVIARSGMNIPTTDLINAFEDGDVRLSMIDTSYIDEVHGVYKGNIVPYTKKYWNPDHQIWRQTGTNFNLFRYPHVLLMLAECYVREGGGDPVPLVNEVRNRAGLPSLSSVTLDEVIQERRVEFHCEADRWDVLVRTGLAVEVMEKHGEFERENRPQDVIGDNAYRQINLLFPIPEVEIQVDQSLEQNPEYL